MTRDSTHLSCCGLPSILCGRILDFRISGAVSASRHKRSHRFKANDWVMADPPEERSRRA